MSSTQSSYSTLHTSMRQNFCPAPIHCILQPKNILKGLFLESCSEVPRVLEAELAPSNNRNQGKCLGTKLGALQLEPPQARTSRAGKIKKSPRLHRAALGQSQSFSRVRISQMLPQRVSLGRKGVLNLGREAASPADSSSSRQNAYTCRHCPGVMSGAT